MRICAWWDGCTRSTASASSSGRQAYQPGCAGPNDELAGARAGQVVVAEIIQQPDRHIKPLGRIVEILGGYADPGMEVEIALRKHELPYVFPEAVRQLACGCPRTCAIRDRAGARIAGASARHHRRRDRQRFRRRGVLPSGGQRFPAVGCDRRRQPLCRVMGIRWISKHGCAVIPFISLAASSRCCRRNYPTAFAHSTQTWIGCAWSVRWPSTGGARFNSIASTLRSCIRMRD